MAARKKQTRPKASTVEQLPSEILDEINRSLNDRTQTQTEILERANAQGANISVGAMNRHSQRQAKIAENLRFAREASKNVFKDLEDVDGDAGRLVLESVQSLLLESYMQFADSDDATPKDLVNLSAAAKNIQHGLKLNAETKQKIREEARKEALHDAAEQAEKTATSKGMSATTVDAIKRDILGIK